MATNPNRKPAGTPAGGQFAPSARPRPGIELDAGEVDDEQAWRDAGFSHRRADEWKAAGFDVAGAREFISASHLRALELRDELAARRSQRDALRGENAVTEDDRQRAYWSDRIFEERAAEVACCSSSGYPRAGETRVKDVAVECGSDWDRFMEAARSERAAGQGLGARRTWVTPPTA